MKKLLFAANDGSIGFEYYLTDGVTTTLIGDLNPGPGNSYEFNDDFAQIGSEFVFAATNGQAGSELFGSDGTAAGTSLLKDINFGTNGSFPIILETVGGKTFFAAITDAEGDELWATDGTPGGTVLIRDINPGGSSSGPNSFEEFNGNLIFSATTNTSGRELYISDGSQLGTRQVLDINPGASSSNPGGLTQDGSNILGNSFFFSANDGTNGTELWVSDGTETGTKLVKDINTTPGVSSSPNNFQAFNGLMYFAANDGVNGEELWVTDGTSGGTQLVKDINPAGSSNPLDLTVLGDKSIFSADNGTTGQELWVSDGTPGGTVLLRDLNGGGGSSSPFGFVQLGDKLIFAATDNSTGRELYITDGTVGGTGLLLDIAAGAGSSNPFDFTLVGDTIFFNATTSANGNELWKTDGTAAGTTRVTDLDPGSDSSNPDLIGVFSINSAPTGLALSASTVAENSAAGTVIGTLSATDADGDALSFSLTSNPGGLFAINGNSLQVAGALDFENATSHQITAQVSDGQGGTSTQVFNITVTDVNEDVGQVVNGTPGNDTLDSTAGNDTINGGNGTDTVIYDVSKDELTENILPNGNVSVGLPGGETDLLTSVERVQFNGGVYRYDLSEDAPAVYRLYAAALGRTPDEAGQIFWTEQSDAGLTEQQLAGFFVDSNEFKQAYGANPTSDEFIDALYNNVLGRDADQAGRDFWKNAFETGVTEEDMLIFFAESNENKLNNADNYDDGVFLI